MRRLKHSLFALITTMLLITSGLALGSAAHADTTTPTVVAAPDNITIYQGEVGFVNVVANDTTSDSGPLEVTSISNIPDKLGGGYPYGSPMEYSRQQVTVWVNPTDAASFNFTYMVEDKATGQEATGTIHVTVKAFQPLVVKKTKHKRGYVTITNPNPRRAEVYLGTVRRSGYPHSKNVEKDLFLGGHRSKTVKVSAKARKRHWITWKGYVSSAYNEAVSYGGSQIAAGYGKVKGLH